jgi:glucokinase
MYVGVDIGGTKTLVAALGKNGVIKQQLRFATPKDYANFLLELRHAASNLETKDFQAGAVAIPGRVDRQRGRGLNFGNLPWQNVNIQHDAERILDCPIIIENDAKLAALSEALLVKGKYAKVVYITISTGIGYALVVDGIIDSSVGDSGGRAMLLEHRGKLVPWEDFASGQAIVRRYGKQAQDITDPAEWRQISRELSQGLIQLVAMLEPELIIIGGSVGDYFDRYGKFLAAELKKYKLPMVNLPELRRAARPEEAVIYGCFDLAKQAYSHA